MSSPTMTAADFDPASVTPDLSTTLIEASAGTGKTTTIAALTTLALAEGWYDVSQIMLVTFGRRAAGELRTSLHSRLVETIEGLERTIAGQAPDVGGAILDTTRTRLLGGGPDELAARLERLTRARLDFDQATIATTHQFCHAMLTELGVLADFDASAQFVEDPSQVVDDVVHETYVRRYQSSDLSPLPYVSFTKELATLVGSGHGTFAPVSGAGAEEKLRLGIALRDGISQRKWQSRTYDFDDMVVGLHRSVGGGLDEIDRTRLPAMVAAARDALSRRFRLVMIDEYQDTDALQWQIVRAAFHHHSQVFLIGDPKQAIYAFRGADVYAYLTARSASDQRFTLRTNRRSSSELVAQVNRLFSGRDLGRDITCPAATGGTGHRARRLDGSPLSPLQLRLVAPTTEDQFPSDGPQWEIVLRDLAEQVKDLLENAQILDPGDDQGESGHRLRPHHINIVVRANKRAEAVRAHLAAAGIPVVFAGADSVFTSPAALDWAALLQALLRPSSATLRRVALTDFFGWEAPDLATIDEDELADIGLDLRRAARALEKTSVAAMFDELVGRRQISARLLARPGGERRLTDLRHVAELLHEQALVLGASQPRATLVVHLARWLDTNMSQRAADDSQTRRLESDGGAVQIMTIHRSKGLSLPVVLLPDLTQASRRPPSRYSPHMLHHSGEPVVSVAPTRHELGQIDDDERDELLRLAYVAATRAQYLARIWWSAEPHSSESPINRLLHDPMRPGVPAPLVVADRQRAREITDLWSQVVDVQRVSHQPAITSPAMATGLSTLPEQARQFTRDLDEQWRRTSYSALTRLAHEVPTGPLVTDEPEPPEPPEAADPTEGPDPTDGPDPAEAADGPVTPVTAHPQPLTGLPGGTEFGGLVHLALEKLDWQASDLAAELARVVALTHAEHPVPEVGLDDLAAGLDLVVRTPLGELTGGRALVDLPIADRLPELDFELPLAGRSSEACTLADLAALFSDRDLVAADDVLASYGHALAESPAAAEVLSGWLTGSIDAVLRFRDEDGVPHHVVVDYKTNRIWLPPGTPLRVEDYTAAAMTEAMVAAHYPLQALLYCVALHRFLKLRQPDYDPGVHLGGVGYLFVRGMAGPEGPVDESAGMPMPHGVFTWRPSAALVEAADAILRGER